MSAIKGGLAPMRTYVLEREETRMDIGDSLSPGRCADMHQYAALTGPN